jgi:plastocyanin
MRILTTVLAALTLGAAPAAAQAGTASATVHEIRLVRGEGEHTFAFVPAQVVARPGDVLLFRLVSGSPHSVVFEEADMTPAAVRAWTAALPRRVAPLTGPILVEQGLEYRVVVPDVEPGRYRFYSLPRLAYDMRGAVVVRAATTNAGAP